MKTVFLLMAQYDARAVIPIENLCRDFFSHLTVEKFLRKVANGEINIPVMKMEVSQKAAKGVHLADLAAYIDARRDDARRAAGAPETASEPSDFGRPL